MSERIDIMKPWKTREGSAVELFSDAVKDKQGSIVGQYQKADGTWQLCLWYSDGTVNSDKTEHLQDLVPPIEIPVKHYWVWYIPGLHTEAEIALICPKATKVVMS